MQNNTIQIKKPTFVKVKDLQPGVHGYNVYVKVLEVNHSDFKRFNGSKLKCVECLLGDDTACIKAKFLGEFTEIINKDQVYAIRNGQMQIVNECMRLSVDRFGKVTAENDHQIESVNTDKNMSDIKFEVKYVKVSAFNKRSNNRNENQEYRGSQESSSDAENQRYRKRSQNRRFNNNRGRQRRRNYY